MSENEKAMAGANLAAGTEPGPAWRAAEEWGCDMAQLARNLELTPAERIRRHSRALEAATELRAAMEARRAEP